MSSHLDTLLPVLTELMEYKQNMVNDATNKTDAHAHHHGQALVNTRGLIHAMVLLLLLLFVFFSVFV